MTVYSHTMTVANRRLPALLCYLAPALAAIFIFAGCHGGSSSNGSLSIALVPSATAVNLDALQVQAFTATVSNDITKKVRKTMATMYRFRGVEWGVIIYSLVVTFEASSKRPGSRPAWEARAKVTICTGKISMIGCIDRGAEGRE